MKTLLVTIALLIFISFARYPIQPLKGDVKSIRIDYAGSDFKRKSVMLTGKQEIEEIAKACGWQWNNLIPLSNEGFPSYYLRIEYLSGKASELYVDQDEVGNASNVNSKLYLLLKSRLG